MNHLIYDVETTGLPIDYGAHVHDLDNWPRLVQLAWMIVDDNFKTLTCRNHIIKPVGFVIPNDAAAIHGINTRMAMEEGTDVIVALKEMALAQELCQIQVGHNVNFDRKILGAELIRQDMEWAYEYAKDWLPKICTMFKTTKLVGLKQPGGKRAKWPTLTELHNFLFDEDFENVHDAMADVTATKNCYQELVNMGHLDPQEIVSTLPGKDGGII